MSVRTMSILVSIMAVADGLAGCDRTPNDPIIAVKIGSAAPTVATPSNASAVVASASHIDVTWQDNSSNETGFEVWRSLAGTSSEFVIAAKTAANAESYGDDGLTAQTQYCYKLRAFRNYDGKIAYSGFSNSPCATTLAPPPPPPPPPPSGPLAAPTLESIYTSFAGIGVMNIVISWGDNSDNEDGFTVERCAGYDCPDSAFTVVYVVGTTGYPSYSYVDAVAGPMSYEYRVRAFNQMGVSAWSQTLGAFACDVEIAEDGEYYCL
jgi:hypothetical protein